ncbi:MULTISPECIES: MAC/perforin domain-containing protein [Corallococcus]|uniref:MAC/perforin domain-containing protein n=1 Tax=Corallococcus TaxID=83461 RepID=UPI00117DEA36|nr:MULTISPECIES: MAC/perforin domain-containing protein [Corallococcus]NBD08416.1 hypothetical protein [Corallococcus silvisoli]TSC34361.1 hypothetical protein FOF48_04865 [Corallococcus sp. Z5C101001]
MPMLQLKSADLPSDPHDFTAQDWLHLFEDRGLFHAMIITEEVNPTNVFSIHQGLQLTSPTLVLPDPTNPGNNPTFQWLIPNLTAQLHTVETFFQTEHTYHEQGYDVKKADIGVPGIFSLKFEHEHEYTNDQSFSETDYFVTSMYRVPKLRIGFSDGAMTLTADFVDALRDAAKLGVGDSRSYDRIVNVLNAWGHYYVKQLDLGGLLFGTDTKKVTSMSQGQSFSDSVSKGFEVKLELEDVPISGGADNGHGTGSSSNDSSVEADNNVTINVIGGDGSLIGKYPAWAASLNDNYVSWHIINTLTLDPVINLIPDDALRNQVAAILINKDGVTPYTQDISNAEQNDLND